ncbi:MAG: FHA domain-containing protein [Tepidisphaeraceae bacterium]
MSDKLHISWDDLESSQVEEKLKQQQAVAGTQSHYEATEVAVPKITRRFEFLYSAIVYLSLFGALGGLVGWGFGEILNYRPNLQREANVLISQYDEIVKQQTKIQASSDELTKALKPVVRAGQNNPYFEIYINPNLTDEQKSQQTMHLYEQEQSKNFIASLLFYGISGVAIAVMLAIADSVMERNINGAIIYGSIGAIVGLLGGVAVAFAVNRFQQYMTNANAVQAFGRQMLTNAICWGFLGLFLAAAPGLILRNGKRLLIGMTGGLIGGVIGGLLFQPVEQWTGSQHLSRLVAIICIGLLAGFASGVIENVVKSGWLKVEAGLIAGKQFVLYRNPTFIGAHPMSHIYLFNDPQVGRRHACIHIIGNGYELEDLPLGSRTYVNGKPITRQRLHNGDKISVGGTIFFFQERAKAN